MAGPQQTSPTRAPEAPPISDRPGQAIADGMAGGAAAAADFLKSLANADRLLILCHLSEGEMTVGELETVFGVRQATMSQRLAVLRDAGLVKTRRDGKSIHYSLASDEAKQTIALMYDLFCAQD